MREPYFVISDEAANDIASLAEYLEFVSDIALAEKILGRFYHLFTLLAHWPDIGRTHKELAGNPHSFTVRPWIVFYEQAADSKSIRVLRVFDGRRDLAILLQKRRKH